MTFAEFLARLCAGAHPAGYDVGAPGGNPSADGCWLEPHSGAAMVVGAGRDCGRVRSRLASGNLFVEHNMPATFEHPLYSWWADQRMVFLMITGQMGKEVKRYASPPVFDHQLNVPNLLPYTDEVACSDRSASLSW